MTRTRSPTCEPTSLVGMRCIDFLLLSYAIGPARGFGEARPGEPNRHLDAFPQIVIVSVVVVIHSFSYQLCAPAHNKKPSSFLEDEGHKPSWCHHRSFNPHSIGNETRLRYNGRFPQTASATLRKAGSLVGSRVSFGTVNGDACSSCVALCTHRPGSQHISIVALSCKLI